MNDRPRAPRDAADDTTPRPQERPLPPPTGLDRAVDPGPVWSGPVTREHIPYHRLSPEERRAAWAKLREAQGKRARKHARAPWVFFGLAVATWVVGFAVGHYGYRFQASLLLWSGIGFAGFGAVAMARNVMGGLAGRKDDLTPPGF